ncbi:MAG TPA: hypothetical protein VLH56_04685 [Dissulfurispiraceae bacterium]|nr:hypothetical protein [Dissulfurispiraceae bacterium]
MQDKPLLYRRTPEEMAAYRKMPADQKLKRLEEQAKFFWKVKQARQKPSPPRS